MSTRLMVAVAIAAVMAGSVAGLQLEMVERLPSGVARMSVPEGWTPLGAAAPSQPLDLIFALRQSNLDVLKETLYDRASPSSPRYGQWLSMEEVADIVAPPKAHVEAVIKWVSAATGVPSYDLWTGGLTVAQDFLRVTTNVSVAETMLVGAKYQSFRQESTGRRLARSLHPYRVPAGIAALLDFVGPVHRFPKSTALRIRGDGSSQPSVTPQILKDRYNVSTAVGKAPNNLQAVAQFLGQFYSPADLAEFQSHFDLPSEPVTKVVGPNDASNPGDEASLDIQYITGVANHVPTYFWSTAAEHEGQEAFLNWTYAVSNTTNPPLVFSVSYGDDEPSVSVSYMDRVDAEFQKLGARGVTIFFASGDDGSGGSAPQCKQLLINFPAESPHVTSVGSTYINTEAPFESAVSFSSGGFSNRFGRPSWQDDAVSAYLSSGADLPSPDIYNKSGRATPDMSTCGVSFEIFVSGQMYPVDGTSCSSPTAAAIFSLLNDLRLQAGKGSLGFLTPALYEVWAAHDDAFYDVTTGTNEQRCPGWPATTGYDTVTGVGTPNYAALSKYILDL